VKRRRQIFYWDSSVFVAFFNEESTRSENVAQILEEAESGDVFIITSSFTLVEAIKLKGSTPIQIKDQKKVTDFFEKDYFRFVDATRRITEAARNLIWNSPGLWPKDAVHLASAIEFANKEELDCIHSYDQDFLALNGKLPISCPVREPIPAQPGLGLKVEKLDRPKKTPRRSN
jgi:predicted nucleic acid-binding protein